jgi:Fe2+ or Zn2+ uptake regulation protein
MSGLTQNPKHEKILTYVQSTPGRSKEDVVRAMNGDPSRITVLNILDKLKKEGLVRVDKDKPNSQVYRLYINNDKPIILASQTLENIKQVSFYILNKVINSPECKEEMIDGKLGNECAMLLLNYQHLIHSLIFNALLKWTKEIKDKDTLTRLYKIGYDNLLEIQLKYSESFKYDETPGVIDDKLVKFDWELAMDNVKNNYQCTVITTMTLVVNAGLNRLKENTALRELKSSFDCLSSIKF